VTAAALIEEAVKSGARKSAACKELEIDIRTLQRWVRHGRIEQDGRKGALRKVPANKLSEEERARVLETANSANYIDKPPSQIVPDLADKGIYIASESTFYRVLREAGQQKHRGRSAAPKKRAVYGHCATGPNQVWSWDITWLPGAVKGLYLYLYMIIDIFSRKIVGWEVYDCESSENASELVVKSAVSESLGGRPFVLHSDNGSPMKGSSLLTTLHNLGVGVSYSRPGVSNDNPYSESIFRTLKYRPAYPYRGFSDIKASRKWVNGFAVWYNGEHRHSGLNFITPDERHDGLGEGIMERRKAVYEKAKADRPNRWSKNIRQMSLPEVVWLNPPSKSNGQAQKVAGL
jgi:transposase InsO family protein